MKVAIIGYGNVGMATFTAMLNMHEIHELVLCGRNLERIEGEVTDFRDNLTINTNIKTKISGGGYEMTKGADIIVFTAGHTVKDPAEGRLSLAKDAVETTRQICEELNKYNRDATMIVISNPVDILVSAIIRFTGRPRSKVIGTGTLLDTARFKRYLADLLDIQPWDITAYVLGEHGDTSSIIWSWTRILGMTIDEFISSQINIEIKLSKEKLGEITRHAGNYIFTRKGSTSYGVAAAAAQIVSAIISDTHEILPVSVELEGEYGISGVALSVPCFIAADGAKPIHGLALTGEEEESLKKSAEVIRNNFTW